MSTEQLLHPLIIAITFIIAAYCKFKRAQYAEVFSFLVASGWFLSVYMFPGMSIETIRVVGRYIVIQIPLVIIFFEIAIQYHRRKYKEALLEGGITPND